MQFVQVTFIEIVWPIVLFQEALVTPTLNDESVSVFAEFEVVECSKIFRHRMKLIAHSLKGYGIVRELYSGREILLVVSDNLFE